MAAGLGFKTFTTGEVLTAADTNGYLMQGVLVFASAAARDAAITSPQEGQFAYLKDTNVTTYYTGSAWANLDTTGMTNPMTTTGDTIYSSSGSTPARLGIGSTGQVLTVSGGIPSWATPASGGKVLQVIMGSTSTTVNNSTSTYTDTGLSATITPAAATSKVLVLVSQNIYKDPNEIPSMRLVRAATTLQRYDANVFVSGTAEMAGYMSIAYLDSPSTTSATTYKTTFCSLANSAYVAVQQDYGYSQNGFSSIILMEIGA
jgi:hypothetical protein